MPVSTSEGTRHDTDLEYWQDRMFGSPKKDAGDEGKMFLVRHGDTACNDEDVVHGWVDQGLNDKGIEQAHRAAESLKDKKVTRIVSSDLPRAKQTANIIAKELGVDVHFDPNLRTWDSGDFDYTNKHDELAKYTRVADQPTQRFYRDEDLPNTLKQFSDTFENRFKGEPSKLPLTAPGESFSDDKEGYGTQHAGRYTLKDDTIRPVWPGEPMRDLMKLPYYPDAADRYGDTWITPETDNGRR